MQRAKIDNDRLSAMVRVGMTCTAIAREFGCSVPAVSVRVKKLSLRHRLQRHGRRSTVDDDLFAKLWLSGTSAKLMARHFGVSLPTLSTRATAMGLPGLLTIRQRIGQQIIDDHTAGTADIAA